ncbi:MAG TPA: hypothetical protein VFC39_05705 [Acidobacteriaceae bacterium]|nr:hypothetical protein [Acidobacteriaceae bacterium]
MRLFIRNTLIALVGVAALIPLFWCFDHAFDWVAFRAFHVPAKSQSSLVRELKFWCEIGLGGLAAPIVLKWKPNLATMLQDQAPERYSVAEPLAFGLVIFAMILIGALAISRFQ